VIDTIYARVVALHLYERHATGSYSELVLPICMKVVLLEAHAKLKLNARMTLAALTAELRSDAW
jgi:hypothetical protein